MGDSTYAVNIMDMPIIPSDIFENDVIVEPTASPSQTHHHDAYKIAIALNNAGVTLIHNSCYLLAAESFRDSLHVLKLATATANDNSQVVDLIAEEMSNKLSNISKRFIECQHQMQQQQQQVSESNMNCSNLSSRNLSIIQYNGTTSSISNAAVDTYIFDSRETIQMRDYDNLGMEQNETYTDLTIKRKQYFAIQIMNHHDPRLLLCPSYEIDTAIILYNYGIAYSLLLYCHHEDREEVKKNVLNKSKQLFLLSHDLLHHISSVNDGNDNNDNNDEHLIIVILLSCFVTISLFQNAMDTETPNEAFCYYQFIRYLRYRYQMLMNSKTAVYDLSEFDCEQHHAAAA